MISFDRSTGKVNLSPVWDAIGSLSSSVMDLNNSISDLPSDVSEYMAYYASINSALSSVNSSLNSIVSSFSNYELISDAFNSSVLTDYAKTSDIPTGGGGKYQYAFSELPSDANYANLYNITGDIGNMTFYSSNYLNLIMTMAGGYFNSNSIESITSLFNNNIVSFCDNTGYIASLELNNCKTLLGNNLTGGLLSLSNCSIKPSNTFNYWKISFKNVSISYLNSPTCTSFYHNGGRISSFSLSGVYGVDINVDTIKRLAITGSGTRGVCNINVYSSAATITVSDFSAANLNCYIGNMTSVLVDSLKSLNMNCTSAMEYNTIKNVGKCKVNCGSSFISNTFGTITNCDIIAPFFSYIRGNSVQTLNLKECSDYYKNRLAEITSLSIDAEYLGSSIASSYSNGFTDISDVSLSGYSMIYNHFNTINNLNITCFGTCNKNDYSSILGDIHLSGHSFDSNTYSSFYGNLYVNCDIFGDYIEHKVSISNWDFSDLDDNCFDLNVNDYFGNVGGVKNVNISALTFRGNVGAIENLLVNAPVLSGLNQMEGLRNVNINCAHCDSLVFSNNTDLNLNITISDRLLEVYPECKMTLDLRNYYTDTLGKIVIVSDKFNYLNLKMPESAKRDFTQLFNNNTLWSTVSINLVNYIPKSDWMSYDTNLINSNLCSWNGMPVSLLA
jgi:hypothetical protein